MHNVIKNKNLVYLRCSGVLTFSDALKFCNKFLNDKSINPKMKLLLDARSAKTTMNASNIHALASHIRSGKKGLKNVIVTDDDLFYGLSRMFSLIVDSKIEIHIFRDLGRALECLDLKYEDLPVVSISTTTS